MKRSVTLRRTEDADGVRNLVAYLDKSGLVIEGHDLGRGVEKAYGAVEYEWTWTVASEHLGALEEFLGGPILKVLKAKYSGENAADLYSALRDSGVPVGGGSRIGD